MKNLQDFDLALKRGFRFPGYRDAAARRLFAATRPHRLSFSGPGWLGAVFKAYRFRGRAGLATADSLELLWLYFVSQGQFFSGGAAVPHMEKMRNLLFALSCQGYSSKFAWEAAVRLGGDGANEMARRYMEAVNAHAFGVSLDLHHRFLRRGPASLESYRSYIRRSPVSILLRLAGRLAPLVSSGFEQEAFCEETHDSLIFLLDLRRQAALLGDLHGGRSLPETLRRPRAYEFFLSPACREVLRDIRSSRRLADGDLPRHAARELLRTVYTPAHLAAVAVKSAAISAGLAENLKSARQPGASELGGALCGGKTARDLELWPHE